MSAARICNKCGTVGGPGDFYVSSATICKKCKQQASREYRSSNLERVRAYDRSRGRSPERMQKNRQYMLEKASYEAVVAAKQAYWEKYPARRSAVVAVGNALRDGKLVRKPCEWCGSTDRVEAHHFDYAQPLSVTWFCDPCHKAIHRIDREHKRRHQKPGHGHAGSVCQMSV